MRNFGKIPPVIDLKQLYYFIATAEIGSISAAASALGLAQATLSENVAKLETRLGTKLAIRGQRGLTLTEAGKVLVRQGKELVNSADALAESIRGLGGELRGPVAVGLPPSLSLLLSVPLTETVFSELPDVRLHVAEGVSGHILEWVADGRVDFGFAYELPDSSMFNSYPFLTEELFLLSAPDNLPLAVEGGEPLTITLKALDGLPLVMPAHPHGSRRVLERIAKANGVNLCFVSEIDALSQIVEMVSRASAYAVVPHAAVIGPAAAGHVALIKITQPECERTAYLVRNKGRPATSATIAVQKILFRIFRELAGRYELRVSLFSDPLD
jgi:LysR family nitrogen assimilation transcriptional regulator